jgi:hypothetical protein
MIPYAQLSPGSGFKPGRAALYYAQRFVVSPPLRAFCGRAIAGGVNIVCRDAVAPSAAARDVASRLHKSGCTAIGPLLPQDRIAEVVAQLDDQPVLVPGCAEPIALKDRPEGSRMATYSLRTVMECEPLLEAANHPFILEIAAAYLGCAPTIASIGCRWSFPKADGPVQTQTFHRDCDDWKFFKLFIYLVDVDEETGPHIYIEGSHKRAAEFFAKPYDEEKLRAKFGAEQFHTFTGAAGTTFLCDTYGIHKGAVPAAKARLIFQVQYSLLPVYAFDYHAVPLAAGNKFGRHVNRLMIDR